MSEEENPNVQLLLVHKKTRSFQEDTTIALRQCSFCHRTENIVNLIGPDDKSNIFICDCCAVEAQRCFRQQYLENVHKQFIDMLEGDDATLQQWTSDHGYCSMVCAQTGSFRSTRYVELAPVVRAKVYNNNINHEQELANTGRGFSEDARRPVLMRGSRLVLVAKYSHTQPHIANGWAERVAERFLRFKKIKFSRRKDDSRSIDCDAPKGYMVKLMGKLHEFNITHTFPCFIGYDKFKPISLLQKPKLFIPATPHIIVPKDFADEREIQEILRPEVLEEFKQRYRLKDVTLLDIEEWRIAYDVLKEMYPEIVLLGP